MAMETEKESGEPNRDPVVVARYTVTLELFVTAIKVIYRFKRLWLVLPIMLLVHFSVLVFTFKSVDFASIGPTILVIPLYFVFVQWLRRLSAKRQLAASGIAGTVVEWQFSSERLGSTSKNATSDFAWAVVKKAYCTQDGLGLFLHPIVMNWIPREAFASDADFNRATELVKTNVKNVVVRGK